MKFSIELLTSRANPLVKWAFSLQEKKWRDRERAFIAEGEKLSYEALLAGLPVSHIFISESRKEKIIPKLEEIFDTRDIGDIRIFILSDGAFEKISTEKAPQGIISVIKYLDFFLNIDIIYRKDFLISDNDGVMVLSSLRDPANLGALIRSAVAFGIDKIIISSDCADIYNPKTVRSAMGSLFKIKIFVVKNLAESIKVLKECGRRVYAAELRDNAVSLTSLNVKKTDVFVIGNEGHGIDADVSAACTGSVYIPISRNTESLNASVAAAVLMWEQNRKQ